MSGASGAYEPKSVSATVGVDGKSATVTWSSDKESTGVVQYGTNAASLVLTTPEETAKTMSHRIALTTLKSNTTYYYRIVVGGETFDNQGTPYTFKTKGGEEASAVTTPVVSPTVVAPTVNTPTNSAGDGTCTNGVDYTGDGVVNSMDMLTCKRNLKVATNSGNVKGATTDCNSMGDYNGDGITNSLDRLKCLQDQKR